MKKILLLLILFIVVYQSTVGAKSSSSRESTQQLQETFKADYYQEVTQNNILILKEDKQTVYKFPGDYVLHESTQWASELEKKIRKDLSFYKVFTQNIEETVSSQALHTSAKLIEEKKPKIVVIALGENDGLYSKNIKDIKLYLSAIIRTAKRNNANVILVGNRLPEYFGTTYINEFADMYAKLATGFDIAYVPEDKFAFTYPMFLYHYDARAATTKPQSVEVEQVWNALEKIVEAEKKANKKSVYFDNFYRFPQFSSH